MTKIERDSKYPNMWRIRRDGSLSDMVNLSRAKDALAQRPHKPQKRSPMRWDGEGGERPTHAQS
jgi:hypothetical protein